MAKNIADEQKRKNYIILAENFYLDGDKTKAVQFYNKALNFNKHAYNDIEILFNIAAIYDELDMPEKSLEIYNRIIHIDKDNEGAYYGVAIMEEQLGNEDKALEYYFKAIEKDNAYDRAYYFAANLYDKKGDRERAIELYEKVIELSEDDYHAYNNLGSLYEEKGDYKKALEMLKKSVDIKSDFFKSLFNLGVVYKKIGEDEMAIEYYNKAKDINKEYYYIYLNLSAIYIEGKRYYESIKILSEGISYSPSAEVLYYNRACSYAMLDMADNAIEDIEKTLKLKPSTIDWVLKDSDFSKLYENEDFKNILNTYKID